MRDTEHASPSSVDTARQPKPGDTPGQTTVISTLTTQRSHLAYSPDEYPFTPLSELPAPVLKALPYPQVLYPNTINANPSILSFYTRSIIPRITKQATLTLAALKRANGIVGEEEYEDDGNYGSAAAIDLEVLQAISKRVHYGKCPSPTCCVPLPAYILC